MGMVLTHDFTDDAGAFEKPSSLGFRSLYIPYKIRRCTGLRPSRTSGRALAVITLCIIQISVSCRFCSAVNSIEPQRRFHLRRRPCLILSSTAIRFDVAWLPTLLKRSDCSTKTRFGVSSKSICANVLTWAYVDIFGTGSGSSLVWALVLVLDRQMEESVDADVINGVHVDFPKDTFYTLYHEGTPVDKFAPRVPAVFPTVLCTMYEHSSLTPWDNPWKSLELSANFDATFGFETIDF